MDMNFENRDDVSIDQNLEMIRLKTAVLLGCSTKLGAIIAGADKENQDLIWDFGINLGLAFQLMDDLLDSFGDEKVFGKRTGGDITSNKKTFLYLKALELADDKLKSKLSGLYSRSDENDKIEKVLTLYKELKIDILTREAMDNYYQMAFSALDKINVPESNKQELRKFTKGLMKRVK